MLLRNSHMNANSAICSSNLGSYARVYDDDEVAVLVRAAIEDEGSQVTFARRHGVNRPWSSGGTGSAGAVSGGAGAGAGGGLGIGGGASGL